MSAIDHRYAVAVFIGYGRSAKAHDARIIPPSREMFPLKEALAASCIDSIELLLTWNYSQRRILSLLGEAMQAPWLKRQETFDNCPAWLQLSRLVPGVIHRFKILLLNQIEYELITKIDPDPDPDEWATGEVPPCEQRHWGEP